MKEIVKFEKQLNDKGATVGAAVVVKDGFLVAQVEAKTPVIEVVNPVLNIANTAIDKLEAAIPGDWDKAILEKVKLEIKDGAEKFLASI